MKQDVIRLNESLEFIESNLFSQIELSALAKRAYMSEYNFHRMFTYLTGYTFAEYLRNRRLSSTLDLLKEDISIDEIADKCGYANRSSFNRAFTRFHGITPSQARNNNIELKYFPPISVNLSISGGQLLEYRLVDLPSFSVVGVENHYLINEELFENTGQQWAKLLQSGEINQLVEKFHSGKSIFGQNRLPYLGIGNLHESSAGYLNYFSGCISEKDSSNYIYGEVLKQEYAVFSSEHYDPTCAKNVSKTYEKLQKRIFTEWFPYTTKKKRNAPELETYVYVNGKVYLEIWIPIEK